MSFICQLSIALFLPLFTLAQQLSSLPPLPDLYRKPVKGDWLIEASPVPAGIFRGNSDGELILSNGLLQRSFRISPDVACVDFQNRINGQQLLRAVKPEARILLNGRPYGVGGLQGQQEQAYLFPSWISGLRPNPDAFHFTHFEQRPLVPYLNSKVPFWKPLTTPATGIRLDLFFVHDAPELKGVEVAVDRKSTRLNSSHRT